MGCCLPEYDYVTRMFLQYWQGQAETGPKRLHRCPETELKAYPDEYYEGSQPDLKVSFCASLLIQQC